MEKETLSRAHLETLSTADLIALSDSYGLDIPDDLNRRFIIGELLEIAEEFFNESETDIQELDSLSSDSEKNVPESLRKSAKSKGLDSLLSDKLPKSFNETQIDVVFRNPIWAYVFWDLKAADATRLEKEGATLAIRVSSFSSEESNSPLTTFDLNVSKNDNGQFLMFSSLSPDSKFVRIDLVSLFPDGSDDSLAVSRRLQLPESSALLSAVRPGLEMRFPPLLELSGLPEVLKAHYEAHRETFA